MENTENRLAGVIPTIVTTGITAARINALQEVKIIFGVLLDRDGNTVVTQER